MLKLNTKTKMTPEEVVTKAVEFFGPGGYGLEIKDRGESGAYFEGGGGGVDVSACKEGKVTSVDMETREWEYQVKEFATKIK